MGISVNGVSLEGGALSAADIADAFAADAEASADLVTALGVAGDPGMPSSGLVALWRASSLALADGDPVGTWAPASGTPGSLTGSGSARPTYRATGFVGGGPCVEFDGSDDELSLSSPAGLPSGAAAGTMVAILSRANHNGSFSHVVQYGSGGPAEGRGLGLTPAVWACLDYQSELLSATADAPRHRRGVVLAHHYDGTTRRLGADGVPVASDAVTLATGAAALHVGRSIYGGERAAFRLAVLAIYNRNLADADFAQIDAHARALGVR
ncbi:MAG: hypothetical protein U0324_29105 [Polyangiales bacterium]